MSVSHKVEYFRFLTSVKLNETGDKTNHQEKI
jgi:hypothetical protein